MNQRSHQIAPHQSLQICKAMYKQSAGFTLVEVLVSIVILSFGVLGVVGLQAAALKSNREAKHQAVAVQLARELADMVRGNKEVGSVVSNNPYVGTFSANVSGTLVPPNEGYCLSVGSSCTSTTATDTATAVAQAQLTEWLAHVGSVLPMARVVTCFDADPYNAAGLPIWACDATITTNPNTDTVPPFVVKIGWTRSALDKSQTGVAALDFAINDGSSPGIVLPFTP